MFAITHRWKIEKIASAFLLAAVVMLFSGCATSNGLASRKQERYAAYEALSPDLKAAVDQGLIKAGMTTDAVYIVWGKPSQITSGGNAAGETTTWLYEGGYVQEYRYWGTYHLHYDYSPQTYIRAQVIFANGVVKEWQTFPQPNY